MIGGKVIKPALFLGLLKVRKISSSLRKRLRKKGFRIFLNSSRLGYLLNEKRILIRGPKIVAIGGGTGLSTMLRGLKEYSSNLTAIVTVFDDGGGSGVLREDLKILPPGDIRNCILALADTEPLMERLLQYRFEDGMLKGQNFGNLFLAAMGGISENFEDAVKKMSSVLAVTGRVLPVTNADLRLKAVLADGTVVTGESNISKHKAQSNSPIKQISLIPEASNALPEVMEAIQNADIICFGPGSLYTSIIPNLLVNGVVDSIKKSTAIKVYICNIMTQPGETDSYSAMDHIKAIEEHSYKGIIDYCIVNNQSISETLQQKYSIEDAFAINYDVEAFIRNDIELIEKDLLIEKSELARHDPRKLAKTVVELVMENVLINDRDRVLDYYYTRERLKS